MAIKILIIALTFSACASYQHVPLDFEVENSELKGRKGQTLELNREDYANAKKAWFPLDSQVELSDGLTLEEANALALFYSPKIVTARAERNIAGSQLIAAGLLPNPDLFFGPRFSTDDGAVTIPGSLAIPFSIFGRRSATKDLAKAQLEAANIEVMLVELEILEHVLTRFIKLAQLQKEIEIWDEGTKSYETLTRWIETLFNAGSADNIALFLARSERDKAFSSFEQSRAELAQTQSDLLTSIGLLPDSTFLKVTPTQLDSPALDNDIAAPQNHPKLILAKANYEKAGQMLRLEIAQQYPDLRLGFEGESDDGEISLGFGVGVTLPIFNQNQTGISAANSQLEMAKEKYREAILELAHGRFVARSQSEASNNLLKNLQSHRLSYLSQARESLQLRLSSGGGDVLEALFATNALNEARIEAVRLESELALSRLREAIFSGVVFNTIEIQEERHE